MDWTPKLLPGDECRIGGNYVLIEQTLEKVIECCKCLESDHVRELRDQRLLFTNGIEGYALVNSALIDYRKSFDKQQETRLDPVELFSGENSLLQNHKKIMALANRHAAHSVTSMDIAGVVVYVGEDTNGEMKVGGVGVQGAQISISLQDVFDLRRLSEIALQEAKSKVKVYQDALIEKAKRMSSAQLKRLPSGFAPNVPAEQAMKVRSWPSPKPGRADWEESSG